MTTSGVITAQAGNVNLVTLTSNSSSQLLTINAGINSNSGSISLSAANPQNIAALIVNAVLNTSPGTGGSLNVGGGVDLNASPVLGGGSITLQGNGLDLTLGTVSFNTPVNFFVNRDILVNGALTTTGAGSNLGLFADALNSGVGGVMISSTGSINSSGNLTISGSMISAIPGGDTTAAVEIQTGGSIQAAGNITLTNNIGSGNILLNGSAQTNTGAINITTLNNANININGSVTTQGTVTANAANALQIGGTANISAGSANLSANSITESGSGIINTPELSTNTVAGTSLTNANTIGTYSATNTGTGNIAFNDNSAVAVSDITQSGTGTVSIQWQ